MKRALAAARLFAFVIWMAANIPILWLSHATKILAPSYNRLYFRTLCLLFGIKVKIRGRLARKRDLLVISNHASYIDILALGSKLKVNFVAKEDVRRWPVFGYIAKLGDTVFINRSRMKATGEINMLTRELSRRRVPLLIFPEGTSSDGNAVLPFKSSLFSLFEDDKGAGNIVIQPISMAYTKRGGKPMSPEERALYGWPVGDDRTLVGHLWDILKTAPFTVEAVIHEPYTMKHDRKTMASLLHKAVDAEFRKLIGESDAGK
ncbi:MAG: 1-acyl-sn-glycerol-3-phosphate acyltransferase [Rickettsiales bacterium]|jgi:1-acyl-sn-glycerol-3-phosphate acyltransferase|nr:1-acyl-sn-glycerol-3-phosphate acyltransferase [Rickettsiales bacterium]